ncbi:helix-turn-helix domain-containing protein [Streptomyces gamaensis]|uniref:Helix-turn-helix domain-containing protein n=1 Tax=Streptomyces gamaensis TaxID=1763542 RepID=A0ABW0Z7R8_9ACTN
MAASAGAGDTSGARTHEGAAAAGSCSCDDASRIWPEVLTAREAAAYLRLDYQLVMRMTRAGALPNLKAGRTYRFHRRALEQVMGVDRPWPSGEGTGRGGQTAAGRGGSGTDGPVRAHSRGGHPGHHL